MKAIFKSIVVLILLITVCSSTDTEDLSLQLAEVSEVLKIPGLANLEDILKALETIVGLNVTTILLQLLATVDGILSGFTITVAEVIILLFSNNLLEYLAVHFEDILNGAVLYSQTSVNQAVDLLGWMMSIAEVTEEFQPILTGIIVGTYLYPAFLEGLVNSLVDVVAKEEPNVAEELKEIFRSLESNVTIDINSLLSTMLPQYPGMLIEPGTEEF